jgi:tetratricopeptide (TPR) repeat protein
LLALSGVWLLGLPGDWLLDDFSLVPVEFPSLMRPRALTYLTFWMNWELNGASPLAFRLTNILLHAVGVQFCYRALRRILGDGRAFFAAAIFAVHPLQSDAVLYIFSRPVVLMGLLLWLALDRWLAGKHWMATGIYALALLAKEEAIAFPLFLLALHFSISRNTRELRPIGVMVMLAGVTVGALVIAANQTLGSGAGEQAGVSRSAYLATQPGVIALYLKQVLLPEFIGFRWNTELAPLWQVVLWMVPLAGLWLGRRSFAKAGWAFWLIGALLFLLPTSSVFPIADLAAARRMYLPLALLAAAMPRMDLRWMLLVAAGYACLAGSWAYTLYREPAVLWRTTMQVQPGKVEPLLQLCKYLAPQEALVELMRQPHLESAAYHTELGRVHLELRNAPEALRAFGKALALQPGVASHVYNRGVALQALGQMDAARADFERALVIDPSHKPARQALATLK